MEYPMIEFAKYGLPDVFLENETRRRLSIVIEMLPYMERIGRLKHGIMPPMTRTPDDRQLWKPWTDEERRYINEYRQLFAHARKVVLQDGSIRFNDKKRCKPAIAMGGMYDFGVHEWTWSYGEFETLVSGLEELINNRIQAYVQMSHTCETCGLTAYGDEFLQCGHVAYGDDQCPGDGALGRKGAGSSSLVRCWVSVDGFKDVDLSQARKMTVVDNGLNLAITAMEELEVLIKECEQRGETFYEEITG